MLVEVLWTVSDDKVVDGRWEYDFLSSGFTLDIADNRPLICI